MKKSVGGQALIEGVMMRCGDLKAIAIRQTDGSISVKKERVQNLLKNKNLYKIPFVRGVFVLVDSMIQGSRDLTYSANVAMDGIEEEDSSFDRFMRKIFGKHAEDILNVFITIVSFAFAILLFVIFPTFLAKNNTEKTAFVALKEGTIKILMFVGYMFIISRMKDIHRVFQYHGSEHKSVFCYEKGLDLTVENVRKMSRLHPRCGTNFIFLVLLISILLFSFINVRTVWQRSLLKILMFPVVSGISYEVIRLAGKYDNIFTKALVFPGMMMQLITTQEPDDKQIEVAIASIKAALEEDEVKESEYCIDKHLKGIQSPA